VYEAWLEVCSKKSAQAVAVMDADDVLVQVRLCGWNQMLCGVGVSVVLMSGLQVLYAAGSAEPREELAGYRSSSCYPWCSTQ
jgi:hypothetical protein